MKLKKEYVILAVVIVGLSIYLLTRQTDRTLYRLPQLPPVPAQSITRIDINGPNGAITLNKADDSWTIGEQKYPADRAKVSRMLDAISDLSLTAMMSESEDYVRYDLSDKNKISVKAWAGTTSERDFDIGKVGPSFRHTFVKLAGDANVYQAQNNFRTTFEQGVEDLRDKVVLSFAASDIQEFRLIKGTEAITLVRHEAPLAETETGEKEEGDKAKEASPPLKAKMVWQANDGRTAASTKVDELLAAVSQLACEKFITDHVTADFKDPIYTLELEGQKAHRLSIFAKQNETANSYPAVSSDSLYPFFLTDWKAKQLMPDFGDLLEPPKKDQK
ncbi:MAG: DUF4340 domain-containing protein [Desulfobacterales bacterium]